MKYTVFLFFLAFINYSCSQIKSKPITEVSQDELKTIVLVDVRTPEEFNAGHLEHALNINWFDANFQTQITEQIAKDKTVYVYCKVGGRSAKAADKLTALGYTVVNLEGGYDTYKKAKH
ncbi:rhodanese-like domain-containing protein [Cellulophaga baltica]|jgi:rhodanese-related sulfurtransferase|uniref:rhodanese-like domain-containing protein n=1 Tax=Cellulophaga baltica TaxID=76594 RepID=UPI0003FE1C4B|nr:rhodanese-like domain-containing protein [Cellulophaga baltica]AIY12009.1 sulfurtransferase [Cellulophaga baltica NN016038]MBA6314189.1 rhodanese-like domain-containing protein [Cellulophaga baltica]